MKLVAYSPFEGINNCIHDNYDIHSTVEVFETLDSRVKVNDTDIGKSIHEKIEDLQILVKAYQKGLI